jgi:hypothetical protein
MAWGGRGAGWGEWMGDEEGSEQSGEEGEEEPSPTPLYSKRRLPHCTPGRGRRLVREEAGERGRSLTSMNIWSGCSSTRRSARRVWICIYGWLNLLGW